MLILMESDTCAVFCVFCVLYDLLSLETKLLEDMPLLLFPVYVGL